MIKGNVPVFDESYDLSDPADTGKTFVSMAGGATLAIAAFAAAQKVWNEIGNRTGVDESDSVLEVTN